MNECAEYTLPGECVPYIMYTENRLRYDSTGLLIETHGDVCVAEYLNIVWPEHKMIM